LQQPACGIGFCPLEENVKREELKEKRKRVLWLKGMLEMKVKGKGFIGEKRCQVSRI